MKIDAINQAKHLRLETRIHAESREDKRRDDHVKTVRADNMLAERPLYYKKEFDVIWLIQHSRIGGSVDTKA